MIIISMITQVKAKDHENNRGAVIVDSQIL